MNKGNNLKQQVDNIVDNSEVFYRIEDTIEGYKVHMYNYRLASDKDFTTPLHNELRGLTFVQQDDGTWKEFFALHKFFNLNQCPGYMLEDIKDKTVTSVIEKLDGSLVTFVKFPNNKIRAKTKMAFDSPQAKLAQEIFDNNIDLQQLVYILLNNFDTPIFELTSPFNQVVVQYNKTDLSLLQIRDENLEYKNKEVVAAFAKYARIPYAKSFKYSMSELLEMKKTLTDDVEGWVITLNDGQMLKVKTDHYLSRHGLISELRENDIVSLVIKDEIDDVLSQLLDSSEKKQFILDIMEKVQHDYDKQLKSIVELMSIRDTMNKRDFALKYVNCSGFSVAISAKSLEDAEKRLKDKILKKSYRLTEARQYLASINTDKY